MILLQRFHVCVAVASNPHFDCSIEAQYIAHVKYCFVSIDLIEVKLVVVFILTANISRRQVTF